MIYCPLCAAQIALVVVKVNTRMFPFPLAAAIASQEHTQMLQVPPPPRCVSSVPRVNTLFLPVRYRQPLARSVLQGPTAQRQELHLPLCAQAVRLELTLQRLELPRHQRVWNVPQVTILQRLGRYPCPRVKPVQRERTLMKLGLSRHQCVKFVLRALILQRQVPTHHQFVKVVQQGITLLKLVHPLCQHV
jgi:hypothetical protein